MREGGDSRVKGEDALTRYKETMRHDNQQIDVGEFLGGNYLGTEDIGSAQVVTIIDSWIEEFDDGKRAVAVQFAEFRKPFTLNKTNLKALVTIFQTRFAERWRGEIGLYVDPEVTNSRGQIVGGVRVKRAESIRPRRVNGSAVQPGYEGGAEEHVDGLMNV